MTFERFIQYVLGIALCIIVIVVLFEVLDRV